MRITPYLTLLLFLFIYNFAITQTSNINSGCAPLTVVFSSPTTSSTYYWDFKDGATANISNPTNTFTTPGTYAVDFKESTTGPIIGSITITVYNSPLPIITTASTLQGCTPLPVSLHMSAQAQAGITITGYSWAMGDGTGFTTQDVNYNYSVPGVYDVTCQIITNYPSCNTALIFDNYISTSNPTALFTTNPNPAIACSPPLNVNFTNTSVSSIPLTYSWLFGNGSNSTLQSPPQQTYTSEGQFIAQLTITDTNNCTKIVSHSISIGNPVASFSFPDTVCLNVLTPLINNSSGVMYWQFDAGTSLTTSNQINPNISFSTGGIHSIHLTVSSPNGLCTDDTIVSVFVEDPNTTITSTPTYSCSEPRLFQFNVSPLITGANYTWTFGDDSTSTLPNPSHLYDLEDTTYAKRGEKFLSTFLHVVTPAGCIFNGSIVDTIHLVFARFMPNMINGCAPLTVTFSDSSYSNENLVSYLYSYGDGINTTYTNDSPNTHVFNLPGTYNVVMRATNSAGCFDVSDTIQIEVGSVIPLDFTMNNTSICPGDSVFFTNISNTTLIDSWNYSSDGELLSKCYGEDNPTFIFNDTVGFFNITLSGYYNGCLSSVTKSNVLEVKGPIAKFNFSYDCDQPLDLNLINQSMGTVNSSWTLGDGQTSNSNGTFTHSYLASADYNIHLIASNPSTGCPDSFDDYTFPIRQIQANFETDTNYCGNVPVILNGASSVDVHSSCFNGYTWLFSDPETRPYSSSDPNPPLEINNSGIQTVSLVVMDINGCTDTLTHQINIFNNTPSFTISDQTICLPDTISFISTSTSDTTITNWNWTFGDTYSSNLESPTHTYLNSSQTSFSVKLTVTNALGCVTPLTKTITVYKPTSTFTTTPSSNICLSNAIQFNASDYTAQGSQLIFDWDFGDGLNGNSNPVSHTYLNSGTYTSYLHYTEQSSGCKDSILKTINVQDYPTAVINTSVDALPALCAPQLINFTSNSTASTPIVSTQWTFSSGEQSTSLSPTFTFPKGDYTSQLIVTTSYGCSDTILKNFSVFGPEGDFTLAPNTICLGDQILFNLIDTADVVEYKWDFGDGEFTLNTSPTSHQYNFIPPQGQTVAKLIMYAENGACPTTQEKTVFIHEVKALFERNNELDTLLCFGDILTINNVSLNSDQFNWDFGDGTTGTNGLGIFTHSYTLFDTIPIQLIVKNLQYGCTDTIIKEVIFSPLPEVIAIGDTVCENNLAQLNVLDYNPNYTYSWGPSTSLSNPAIYNPTTIGIETELYTVTVYNPATTCSNTDHDSIFVLHPIDDINFDTTIVIGDVISLPISNLNGLINFTWTNSEGLSCINCSYPTVNPLDEITYNVVMEDILGCFSAEGIFHISIYPETFVELPTTFTPNGDGINDIIFVKGWGIKDLLYFQVYDRWGELIFESTELSIGWDGYYKGLLQNNGTYVYKVKVLTYRNEEIEKNGHINLMR